jgi:uncharacterized membrane protein YwaF
MIWGFFSIAHIVSLIFGAATVTGLYLFLKNKSARIQIAMLGILSFAGIAAIIFNLIKWNSPLEYLPLHLCSLNALALPIAVFTKNKILNNTLLLWCFGALFALVLNNSVAEADLFGDVFIFYYFPHVLELGIPIIMFALGLVKKDVRCIFSTLGITFFLYTVIHFINLWVNAYAVKNNIVDWAGNVISVNYMFSLSPENPLLDLFYKIIPHPYWYMYLAAIPMVTVLGIVYIRDILALIKKRYSK